MREDSCPSPAEVLAEFNKNNPRVCALPASGFPYDAKGVGTSDCDGVRYYRDGDPATLFDEEMIPDDSETYISSRSSSISRRGTWYFTPADSSRYKRVVTICVSTKMSALRSHTHYKNEEILTRDYPKLAANVAELKRGGMGTEAAWVKVLGLHVNKGETPYDLMEKDILILSVFAENV